MNSNGEYFSRVLTLPIIFKATLYSGRIPPLELQYQHIIKHRILVSYTTV